MLSDRCVCLSVTFGHCGQMVGRIKMKLCTQVGLGPGHIVLDGDPAFLPPRHLTPDQGLCLWTPMGARLADPWFTLLPRLK